MEKRGLRDRWQAEVLLQGEIQRQQCRKVRVREAVEQSTESDRQVTSAQREFFGH